ncbi:MAG: hypothetical protein Q4F69_10725 [Bacteroidia bacterium]|nr:hypothetical protein [Bacteroidia bacterium]
MKKLTLIVSALALVLGLSQCKKPNVPIYNGGIKEITFNASGNGAKGDYQQDGSDLKMQWEAGDQLFVYASQNPDGFDESTGSYLGVLNIANFDGEDASFRGGLKITSDMKYLRFVHVGQGFVVADNGTATMNYSTQDGIIEKGANNIGKKTVAYMDAKVSGMEYGGYLKAQHAVIKFDFKYFKGSNVTLKGYTNDMLVLGTNGSLTAKSDAAEISLGTVANNDYYLIVLPEASGTTFQFSDGTNTYNRKVNNENGVEAGKFYTNGGGPTPVIPEDALPGFFEIRPDGTQIHFSKGNLQYLGTGEDGTKTPTWRFADHQYDYMGQVTKSIATHKGNVDIYGYTYYNYNSMQQIPTEEDTMSARDLFGWGCTGYIDTRSELNGDETPKFQKYYQPYNTYSPKTITDANYYGPDAKENVAERLNLTVENKSDWGCIPTLPGNSETKQIWFTLSKDEWCWLVGPGPVNKDKTDPNYPKPGENCRKSSTIGDVDNARCATAEINGVNGLLVFPDKITWPEGVNLPKRINEIPDLHWVGNENIYSKEDFIEMEKAGVVFLPAAGYMIGTGETIANTNYYCAYWSTSNNTSTSKKWYAYFAKFGSIAAQIFNPQESQVKQYHLAVRLVTLAE